MSLRLEHVTYTYDKSLKGREKTALQDVTATICDGDFVALIGHTGSGKSTLVQLLNGLLQVTEGKIYYDEQDIQSDGFELKSLRQKVGLVFQYPEHQLFEMTVLKDVCFGPKNLGMNEKEQIEAAKRALRLVGLDESYDEKSPFELSGGEKRRVAIAGVLAMNPAILILDEPTAGLDPLGRRDVLSLCKDLNRKEHKTIILVSHSMEDVAAYANRILVMSHGKLLMNDTPRAIFSRYKELEDVGLSAPGVVYLMNDLKEKGFPVRTDVLTLEEAKAEILKSLGMTSKTDAGSSPAKDVGSSPVKAGESHDS